LAPALFCHRLVEAGVEDQRAALADHRPDEIVERHRPVMRIAAIKIVARPPVVMRVFDRINLVDVVAHPYFSDIIMLATGRTMRRGAKRPAAASMRLSAP